MSHSSRTYPSKLILYGEYTVLNGGQALAIPLNHSYSQWQVDPIEQKKNKYNKALLEFGDHARSVLGQLFHDEQFKSDVDNGLFLWSNIPIGYGMGSSGSVCAAFYDKYCTLRSSDDLKVDLSWLAQLESYFHGKSSGMDPIVSYHQCPILKDEHGLKKVTLPANEMGSPTLFLLDSTKNRSTAHLVDHYKKECKTKSFVNNFVQPSMKLVNKLIGNALIGNHIEQLHTFKQLSKLQLQFMKPMIIDPIHNAWSNGIESDQYFLKLCGAGGGGYYLGMTDQIDKTFELAKEFNLTYL